MIGLDKFLEFVKDPKIIIPTLLAIIIVGGISGGLWIGYLKEMVDNQESISQKRLILEQEIYSNTLKKMTYRYNDFEYEISRLNKCLEDNTDSIQLWLSNISQISNNLNNSKSSQQINIELEKINQKLDEFRKRIDNIRAELVFSESTIQFLKSPIKSSSKSSPTIIILIAVLTILILIISIKMVRRFTRKK